MKNQTAILLFSRNPYEDAEIKSLKSFRKKSGNCFEKSLTHVFNVVKYSGLDYFVSTTKEKGEEYFSKLGCELIVQSGEKFGERFHHSIKTVFEKGYENIIVIGNDTPSLKLKDINFAVKHTSENNSVIGPSKDGGFYLLSLNKYDFKNIDTDKFVTISYQQSNTLSSMVYLLNNNSIYLHYLKKKDDFDMIFTIQDYILFQNQIQKAITEVQNIIFNNLYLKFILTLFIRYKNSVYTFTSLSSPPIHI